MKTIPWPARNPIRKQLYEAGEMKRSVLSNEIRIAKVVTNTNDMTCPDRLITLRYLLLLISSSDSALFMVRLWFRWNQKR